MKQQSDLPVKLFYSYSHQDSRFRISMERSLAQLKNNRSLVDWSDQAILPGQKISTATRANMNDAHIIAFLISPNFIASDECLKEWEYADQLASANKFLFRIPIIVRESAWMDLLGVEDLKALPTDGVPVDLFDKQDKAWKQVYDGIKAVVAKIRATFELQEEFKKEMERTDFLSQQHIKLQDIFVFTPLQSRSSRERPDEHLEEFVTTPAALLDIPYTLIHGEDRSGKTALGRFMFLTSAEQTKPVLYIDLNQVHQKPGRNFLRDIYQTQFTGDFSLWMQQSDKTLIIDNLSGLPHLTEFVVASKKSFTRIIITLSSNVFYSFFKDESRLADFQELHIGNLTHVLQEELIRKRIALSSQNDSITDGDVDRIENQVNSIIINERIVPRYPFFVLCILQTYETYMPSGMAITSYGHCYYALIVASLNRAGISQHDRDMNTCFNFSEHLAYSLYLHKQRDNSTPFDFHQFIAKYRDKYYIADSIINRLKNVDFGLITEDGQFRSIYMYHFFLGKYLSNDDDRNHVIIQGMCDAAHEPSNYLTLLFAIHHASDLRIIDEILLRTMTTLDHVEPAILDRIETRRFRDIVSSLPNSLLTGEDVKDSRRQDREARDRARSTEDITDDEVHEHDVVNGCFRILKNNEIMGQILRTKSGSLTKVRIEEIIEILADGGLRLVNLLLKRRSRNQ